MNWIEIELKLKLNTVYSINICLILETIFFGTLNALQSCKAWDVTCSKWVTCGNTTEKTPGYYWWFSQDQDKKWSVGQGMMYVH